MAKPDQSRRKFLGTLIFFLAGMVSFGRYLRPALRQRRALLSVKKKDLPVQGALVFKEARVALVHEGGAVYALSLVCTHLGCTVNVTPTDLVCPCHGSSFDHQGRVLKGPADRCLERHQVVERGEYFEVVV